MKFGQSERLKVRGPDSGTCVNVAAVWNSIGGSFLQDLVWMDNG